MTTTPTPTVAEVTDVDVPKDRLKDPYTVVRVVDLNNLILRTEDGRTFSATHKDTSKIDVGDKVRVTAAGVDDGVPQAAAATSATRD